MDYQDIISTLALAVSLSSLLWASGSHRIAKKALYIANKERDAKKSNIDVHLVEVFTVVDLNKNKFIISQLLYTNKAEMRESISRIELILEYLVDGALANVVIEANSHKFDLKSLNKVKVSIPPFGIEPRDTLKCWLCFPLPKRVIESDRIKSYEIEALSSSGNTISIKPTVVGEIYDKE